MRPRTFLPSPPKPAPLDGVVPFVMSVRVEIDDAFYAVPSHCPREAGERGAVDGAVQNGEGGGGNCKQELLTFTRVPECPLIRSYACPTNVIPSLSIKRLKRKVWLSSTHATPPLAYATIANEGL